MRTLGAGLALVLLGACNAILGIDEPILASAAGGASGTADGGTAGTGKGGSGGTANGGSLDGGDGSSGEGGTVAGEGGGGTADPCGNGKVDPGESCDDGDADPSDECTTDCRRAVCGDRFVRLFLEECDDGNADDLDGCSHLCRIEHHLATGGRTSCVIAGSELRCWGKNEFGQLGQGDADARGDEPGDLGAALLPVDLGSGFVPIQVSPNENHTCAVSTQGAVKCWGYNWMGLLGLGDTEPRGDAPDEMGDALPAVDLGTNFVAVQVAAGSYHNCALSDTGRVKCWGPYACWGGEPEDYRGDEPNEMGDALPYVDLGSNFITAEIGASNQNTCARSTDGRVKCWGSSGYAGQQGQGHEIALGDQASELGSVLPFVNVGTNVRVRQLSVGVQHTCVLTSDGQVKCWGHNYSGELGIGDQDNRGSGPGQMGDNLPALDFGSDFVVESIEAGDSSTCARSTTGTVKCWGYNGSGVLGLGDVESRGDQMGEMGDALPLTQLGAGLVTADLAVGASHACALFTNGSVKCWGWNDVGQLGLGDLNPRGDMPDEMGDFLLPVDLE